MMKTIFSNDQYLISYTEIKLLHDSLQMNNDERGQWYNMVN